MKTKLLFLTFTLLSAVSLFAFGTVEYHNNFGPQACYTNSLAFGGTRGKVAALPGFMWYGLFYSNASEGGVSNNLTLAIVAPNTSSGPPGVINGSTVQALPGVLAFEQVWITIIAWDGALGSNGYSHYIGPYGSGNAGGPSGQWDGAGRWFGQSTTVLVTAASDGGAGSADVRRCRRCQSYCRHGRLPGPRTFDIRARRNRGDGTIPSSRRLLRARK
jgi:hypothetical protein